MWKTWPQPVSTDQSSQLVSEARQMTHCTPGMAGGLAGAACAQLAPPAGPPPPPPAASWELRAAAWHAARQGL